MFSLQTQNRYPCKYAFLVFTCIYYENLKLLVSIIIDLLRYAWKHVVLILSMPRTFQVSEYFKMQVNI